jgi:hypothetical protein
MAKFYLEIFRWRLLWSQSQKPPNIIDEFIANEELQSLI